MSRWITRCPTRCWPSVVSLTETPTGPQFEENDASLDQIIQRGRGPRNLRLARRDRPPRSVALLELLKQVSDPTRLQVLMLLSEKERNVTELCADLGTQSQPAVSHHLALLRHGRLIEPRRAGKHISTRYRRRAAARSGCEFGRALRKIRVIRAPVCDRQPIRKGGNKAGIVRRLAPPPPPPGPPFTRGGE